MTRTEAAAALAEAAREIISWRETAAVPPSCWYVDLLKPLLAAYDAATEDDGWRPIGTADDNQVLDFWLDWHDDFKLITAPLPWKRKFRLFRGKNRCWSSVYTGMFWRALPPLPPPPTNDKDAEPVAGLPVEKPQS